MNCRDAERLLDTFFDGELDGRLMREAALHVTRCKRCEGEIADREQIQELLVAAIDDELAGADAGLIWHGVEAAIAGDGAGEATRRRRGGALGSASWMRLAAASTRATGIVLRGRRSAGADRAFEDALDPAGEWLLSEAPVARRRSWSMGAVAALAASLAAAVYFGLGEGPAGAPQVANVAPPAGGEAVALRGTSSEPQPAVAVRAGGVDRPATAVASAGQVQVESVDYSGRSLAMWTEPETDTTVIWVEEDDPSLAVKPAASR